MFIDIREAGSERERETEKNQYERETSTGCLSYVPQMGGGTHKLLVYRMMFQPAESPSQGRTIILISSLD